MFQCGMTTPRQITVGHHFPDGLAALVASCLPEGVRVVRLSQDKPLPLPDEVDVLLVLPVRAGGAAMPEVAPNGWPYGLKAIQCLSAGIDEYPRWMFTGAPPAATASGSTAIFMAEFVMAAMLAFEKAIPAVWINDAAQWATAPLGTLHGKALGLIGFGAICQGVAERALPFGMTVLCHKRSEGPSGMAGVENVSLASLLAASDHVVVGTPLTEATRGLINARTLALFKPGAHFINVARGGIVDQEALMAALDAGQLAMATLDVTEPEPLPAGHPLYTHPKVRVSAHTSWAGGPSGLDRLKAIITDNITRFANGEPMLNPVDPEAGY
jgi:phosphoglycerate dehydrogenase-like enzyme